MFNIGFFIQAIALGIALAMDCFTVSITCGLQKSMSKSRTLLLAFCFAFFQAFMPLLGSVLTSFFYSFIEFIFTILGVFDFFIGHIFSGYIKLLVLI